MVLGCLSLLLLLPTVSFAEESSSRGVLDLYNETEKKLKSMSGTDSTCPTCQTSSGVPSVEKDAEACEDLFSATCLNPDGTPKHKGAYDEIPKALNQKIVDARDKTAREMGYKNFDDALKKSIEQAGIKITDPIDVAAWKNFKKEDGPSAWGPGDAKKLYSDVATCFSESGAIQRAALADLASLEKLREAETAMGRFEQIYLEKNANLQARDLPEFFRNQLSVKCQVLEDPSSPFHPEDNPEIAAKCKNLAKLKLEAIELFRIEGTPDYQKRAENFVSQNLLPLLKVPSKATPGESETDRTRNRVRSALTNLESSCRIYSKLIEDSADGIYESLLSNLNRRKTMVDSVVDSFYGESRKKAVTKIFQDVRTDLKAITSQIETKNSKKQSISQGYENLTVYWLDKPDLSSYRKNKDGTYSLDYSRAPPANVRGFSNDVYSIFSDPSLSYFTTVNANYRPRVEFGKREFEARVDILPAVIQFAEKNPMTYLAVIAHEAGHMIAPSASETNGFDLTAEYKDLLACYRDPKSIRMLQGQENEVFADYYSAEVLAIEISKLPPSERPAALKTAMEIFCLFADSSAESVNCRSAHPEDSLRVAGIFGANPNLRKAVGCNAESKKFKSCGLRSVKVTEKGK